jgi:hypothetical protein
VADEPVRVDLVRSGGFAGLSMQASADTAALPAGEAGELATLVDKLDLADLAERAKRPVRGADRYQYDLTIQRGRSRHQVSVAEESATPELKALVSWLLKYAAKPGE